MAGQVPPIRITYSFSEQLLPLAVEKQMGHYRN